LSIRGLGKTRRFPNPYQLLDANLFRIAELKILHEERRRLQPEKSPTLQPELVEPTDIEMEEDASIVDTEDEEPQSNRSLRRGNDRAAERKRKHKEEEERRLKAIEAKQTKGTREYQRILKKVEQTKERIAKEEDAIISVDNDLREADCPRTRVLGKDRFWNRYYWFERNAMPYEGLPDASTADAGYANGRLWIQGPDDLEREGFIDVKPEENSTYFRTFQMTPAERKSSEEGPTSVFTARQWGFYENAEDIDMLIGWLDTRGNREIKLRKELSSQREVIARYMDQRKAYLAHQKAEAEEEELLRRQQQPPPPPTTTRMSTRTKPHINNEHRGGGGGGGGSSSSISLRCMRWRNEMAVHELGHKHMEPPVPSRTRGGAGGARTAKKGTATPVAPPVLEDKDALPGMVTRNRQGKVLSRQGGRYNF
jgi:Williams-Beuren syndrome DDT (WSD), D-TOX E motif